MTESKRVQKPRDVDYTIRVVDELPEQIRRSVLREQIEKITSADAEGRLNRAKFVQIGSYGNGSAASAAANQLRQRHGDKPEVDGFEFRVVRADEEYVSDTGEVSMAPRTGLFVRFDPDRIIPGARDDFELRLKTRKEKVTARREARLAEKAKEAKKTARAS